MNFESLTIATSGQRFYSITEQVDGTLRSLLKAHSTESGVLHLFVTHTSCALTITESYDPAAARDMESFLDNLAPQNLGFITHTDEGPDDSPSHMKSILMQTSLSILVDKGEMVMGSWQGIFLTEFRDAPKNRKILVKFQPDAY